MKLCEVLRFRCIRVAEVVLFRNVLFAFLNNINISGFGENVVSLL